MTIRAGRLGHSVEVTLIDMKLQYLELQITLLFCHVLCIQAII
jgi:hypothetical protein